ncbi:DUF1127 domain-containing protein [Gynuella sunshinyii]|uniref:DUF1127 domain-containing protein n=1 Tax=Gynuella sunshinyii TaxID=1445505 RepID=UPI0005CBBBFA|nr:DUF1127 domain-containing protein [Gynuella sunshinyii]
MENTYKCAAGCSSPLKARLNLLEKLKKIGRRVGRWNRNYRQRKQLMEISGFLLKDMGITKTDLRREIQKPFWKD